MYLYSDVFHSYCEHQGAGSPVSIDKFLVKT